MPNLQMNQLSELGEEFVSDYLAHYSSQYYDPAKAREYYLKNRELKGRRSTKGFSEDQKQAWSYAKDQISTEKKTSLKGTSENQKTELTGLRKTAMVKRKILAKKIAALMKGISLDTKAQIEALPKVPKGLSKEARAKFAAKRKEEILKIRGEAKAERKGEQLKGDASRKKVAADLKGVLDDAKGKYSQLRDKIKSDYDAKYQAEYEAIKSNV